MPKEPEGSTFGRKPAGGDRSKLGETRGGGGPQRSFAAVVSGGDLPQPVKSDSLA